MEKEEAEIPEELVEKTTKEVLDNLSFFKKGHVISLMNISQDEAYRKLKKGEPSKIHIITIINREIAKKMGVGPKQNKRVYFESVRLKIKQKVIQYITSKPEINEKLQKLSKKFRVSEGIGRGVIGRQAEKVNKRIRNRRMGSVEMIYKGINRRLCLLLMVILYEYIISCSY